MNTGYLPSQVQLQDRNEASAALLGQRSTLVLNVYQTITKNLGPLSNPDNNFANANQIDWLGFGLTWSHKLTPRATAQRQCRAAADQAGRGQRGHHAALRHRDVDQPGR